MANYNKGKKYHFIYKTTNLINSKYYIGMHSTNNLKDGYLGSGKKLRRSINKYGVENFKCEILEFLTDRDLLAKREKEIVNEELLKDPMCMNLKEGGFGGFCSDDHRIKFHESSKAARKTDRYKQIMSIATSKLWKDDEYRKIHTAGLLTSKRFLGKLHSNETKQKMSLAKKGNGIKENNSQYGTCWVTNGFETKKIKKENLETFIKLGWKKGRVFI